MIWCTLFGLANDEDSEHAFHAVTDWAVEYDVSFAWKELTERVREEYFVDSAPTLRFFVLDSAMPRSEFIGLDAILGFVNGEY